MNNSYLTTQRLHLRHLRSDDLDRLLILNSDLDVMTYIEWQPPSREQVAAEVRDLLAEKQRYPNHGRFIAENHEGDFLGWFGLLVTEQGPSAPSLGYRLRRAVWGQGLATEGSRALIDHAFTNLDAERVTADAMATNAASRRVMEKCGLRYKFTFHKHFDNPLPGTELGEVLYEITRDEWEQSRHIM